MTNTKRIEIKEPSVQDVAQMATLIRVRDNAVHVAHVLARRCYEQSKELARLLAKYEPTGVPSVEPENAPEPDPVHAAIAVMQMQGVR